MSTMKVTNLKHESSSVNNIVLNSDGSVGGELATTLASKADYPSGGTDGDMLTKSGTSTAWATPSSGGLVHIHTETFSGVSSVSVNTKFTSTYANYRLIVNCLTSTGTDVGYRLRASGSDLSSSSYIIGRVYKGVTDATSLAGDEYTHTSFLTAATTTAPGLEVAAAVDLFDPQKAKITRQLTFSTARLLLMLGGVVNNTTQYDGMTLLTSSGTFSGTLQIYGYTE